jgi:coatomer protein complex subunit epsilon
MSDPDELYTLRNLFWNGCYQLAINEANGLFRTSANLEVEKKEFLYRSFLALGQYDVVTSEIKDDPSTPIVLQAIKVLAAVESSSMTREAALNQFMEWLSSPPQSTSQTSLASLQLFTAILYMQDDNVKEAIKTLQTGANLEQQALLVQLYLKMDRSDVASKVLRTMTSADEDSTLCQLASAWVHMATGKSVEAVYIFDELSDKHGGSSLLRNGTAVAKMHLGEFVEAETILQESLSSNANDPDTLANLIVASQHLNKSEEVMNRYLKQLQKAAPQHQLVLSLANFDSAFDRVATTLAA